MTDANLTEPYRSPSRVLAGLAPVMAMAVILLCAFGYLWSLFFDLPGHELVAFFSIPGLITSLIYGVVIHFALRRDAWCRRLSAIGLISNGIALCVCLAVSVFRAPPC